MANAAYATPDLLTDPGYIYYAPLGSTLPTNTVAGSVFTDTWPVAWIPLGQTSGGSTWTMSLTVAEIDSAELIDPLAYRTTARAAKMECALLNVTATNLSRALNGATITVTGSTTTTLSALVPPAPGSEVRAMVGFESLDSTVRAIGYQCINSGDIAVVFAKSPSAATIPFTFNFEKPSSTQPFGWWTAGVARA